MCLLSRMMPPAHPTHGHASQSIAAAAALAEYGDVLEVLLPLVERLARDEEAEIRAAVVKQLHGLGVCGFRFGWVCVVVVGAGRQQWMGRLTRVWL